MSKDRSISRFESQLNELERLAESADRHMPAERARVVKETMQGIIRSYRASVAAMSPEMPIGQNDVSWNEPKATRKKSIVGIFADMLG